jgi:hypothetical protein
LVGVLRGYPRSAEAHERKMTTLRDNSRRAIAAGRLNRRGVPNGWAGRKPEIEVVRRNSQTDAERLLPELCPDMSPPPRIAPMREDYPSQEAFDEARVALALLINLEIAISPLHVAADRLRAARQFLEFSMPKPIARAILGADGGAADFLTGLVRHATK